MASAPLDMAAFHRGRDGAVPDHYAMRGDMADPMRTVSAIRPGAAVFVLGDRYDRSVPASAWEAWAAAARRAGLRVHTAEVRGFDRPELGGGESRHLTTTRGMEVAEACAEGASAERILQALRSDEPLLVPQGRRLGAGEIRAAVAGRSLRGSEWSPRVDISSFWGAGGELYYLDLRRGERRLAELRWRVEGDRLCTTRHGCDQVLSDGRALHLVKGEPPRLAVTLLEEGPGAAPAAPAPAPAPAPAVAGAVRLLVGFGLGSNTDWVARIVAEALRERLGRPVVVENLPGRAAATAAEAVARAAPDGATLGLFPASLATVRQRRPAAWPSTRWPTSPRSASSPPRRASSSSRRATRRATSAAWPRRCGPRRTRPAPRRARAASCTCRRCCWCARSARRAGPCTTPSRPRPWPTSRPAGCRSTSTTPLCPSWPRARAGPRRSP